MAIIGASLPAIAGLGVLGYNIHQMYTKWRSSRTPNIQSAKALGNPYAGPKSSDLGGTHTTAFQSGSPENRNAHMYSGYTAAQMRRMRRKQV
jgi:hypothetical protein